MMLIAGLLIWAFLDDIARGDVLVAQLTTGSAVSLSSLEDINEGRHMLTYKNEYDKRVEALNARYDVRIIATNYTWPFVMEQTMLSGSFFSHSQQSHRNRVAVLNEAASFTMFGAHYGGGVIWIDGERYVVSGVISDKEDNPIIYIPATLLSNTANFVIMGLDENLTREMAKGILSGAGVVEPRYEFSDFRQLRQLREQRFEVAFYIAVIAGLKVLAKKINCEFINKVNILKSKLTEFYFLDLCTKEIKLVISAIGFALTWVLVVVLQFALILRIFEMLLVWYDVFV